MGRGGQDKAAQAQGLLYGRPRRGSGPDPYQPLPLPVFAAALADGRLALPLTDVEVGPVHQGYMSSSEYISGDIIGVWDNPAALYVCRDVNGPWLLLDYDRIHVDPANQGPTPGSGREGEFLATLAATLKQDDLDIAFAFNSADQLDKLAESYDIAAYRFSRLDEGVAQPEPSQAEIMRELVARSDFDGLESGVLTRFDSFAAAYHDPAGRKALYIFANNGGLSLTRPLNDFLD